MCCCTTSGRTRPRYIRVTMDENVVYFWIVFCEFAKSLEVFMNVLFFSGRWLYQFITFEPLTMYRVGYSFLWKLVSSKAKPPASSYYKTNVSFVVSRNPIEVKFFKGDFGRKAYVATWDLSWTKNNSLINCNNLSEHSRLKEGDCKLMSMATLKEILQEMKRCLFMLLWLCMNLVITWNLDVKWATSTIEQPHRALLGGK